MKKLLLSALAVIGFASFASAETYNLEVSDATNIDGTLVEERAAGTNSDSDKGEAKHYSPLNSLEISGFSFSFTQNNSSTKPALYYPFGTNTTTQIRLYKQKTNGNGGNTMTITAPEGVKFGKITFVGSNGTADAVINATAGAVSNVTSSGMVWQSEEVTNTVTLTLTTSAFRITSMTVETEAGGSVDPDPVDPDPVEPEGTTFVKANTLETGKYIFVVGENIAVPVKSSYSYGYMYLDVDVTKSGEDIVTDEAYAINVTVADGKAILLDPANRYYGMDDTHLSSFQCYSEITEGCYWNYEFVGEELKLTNGLNPECFVCKTTYNNIAPAKAPAEYTLPVVYKKADNSAVVAVEAEVDANAPVVYYNLQGQRVANPENGLYIRVQGNKVEKVALR